VSLSTSAPIDAATMADNPVLPPGDRCYGEENWHRPGLDADGPCRCTLSGVPDNAMYAPIRSLLLRFQIFRDLREGRQLRAHRESRTAFPILVDYEVRATPRYGYGRPPHPELLALLNADRRKYAETLYGFLPFRSPLGQIPLQQPPESRTPYWLTQLPQFE
jgi:hypothetical protein